MKKTLISIFAGIGILCFLLPVFSSIDTETIFININEMERISLNVFQVEGDDLEVTGYLVTNEKNTRLPIGSTLDKKKGIFYWGPGPGFLGEYEFIFKSAKLGKEKKVKICISSKFGEIHPAKVRMDIPRVSSSGLPFGEFSTPGDGSTVRGSIAVTGWALDDNGIENVKIYRTQGNTQVYIGEAILVEGARQDVAALYPDYPFNTKAGWGYMLLTNFLPNGGNGTFKIHAIATDTEGISTPLGTKTIYADNANAVKPFGAIDTPTQGGDASGSSFVNWGWVLTPMPNSIPTDGSTINVFVDGVNLGHPTYDIYREDIATLFPGYANSDGAIGYFNLNTTAYESGVHTIYWTATDNAGNTDGIGSRYFTIKHTSVNGTDVEKLSESTTDAVTNISEDGMTITFDSTAADTSNLEVGDFIIGGVSNTFPDGILREITSVSSNSSSYTINTQTASIEDAIEDADITKTVQLTSADIRNARTAYGAALNDSTATNDFSLQLANVIFYDHDGNYNTTNDQVKLDGEITFSPEMDFRMKIKQWKLKEFKTAFTFTADVEVIASANLEFNLIDKSITLFEAYLTPITTGPVVITPKIGIVAGIKGDATVSFQFGAGAGVTSTIGVEYRNENWSKIDSLEKSFYAIGPTLNAGLNVKGQLGPTFSLLLYGVTGPYFNVNAYGELDANINDDPWWRLYGGFNVVGGVTLAILSHTLADYSVEILDFKKELANSGGSGPTTYTLDVTKGAGVNGTPDSGSTTYNEGETVNYSYSLKSGYSNLVVKLDGNTAAASGTITMDSDHTLTATATAQGTVNIEWINIPAGNFQMGDNFSEGSSDELPVHTVYLSAYKISKYEVTFDQYDAFCDDTGRSKPVDIGWGRGTRPVLKVSWNDAKAFCDWMSQKTGKNIHLPTEAQWEKAARGTDQRRYPWGNSDPSCSIVRYNFCQEGTMPVGSYSSGVSPYGTHDMAGNVWEWCSDRYSSTYYSSSPGSNPKGPSSGSTRVGRGGGWYHGAYGVRSAYRSNAIPSYTSDYVGFRLAQD